MVSIVIPTLMKAGSPDDYARRLAVYKHVQEVIVVVNDAKMPNPKSQVPSAIHVIYQGKNTGFTGACNAGAKIAKGELMLFLNDDCEMTEETLLTLVDFMEKNVDVVATQPIVNKSINNYELPITNYSKEIENVGFWVDTRIGKAHPNSDSKQEHQDIKEGSLHPRDARSRDDRLPLPSTFNLQASTNVYGLSGTCLLIRRDIFQKVGMWDESFHSYLEDVDLAIRLHKAGYKVSPCLDAEVTHAHMATSSKMGLYKEKQDVKNWWRLILKHPHVFVRPGTIFPLLLERGRNMSGLIKKFLNRVIQ